VKRLCLSLLIAAAPAVAQEAPPADAATTIEVTAAPLKSPFTAAERSVPAQLSASQREAYARIFRAIDRGQVSAASAELAAMPRGLLHPTAEAQLLLAQGSGAGLTRLVAFLEANPEAPQANAIAGLARKAGATDLPQLARTKQLMPVRLTPALGPRGARLESAADESFAAAARAAIAADDPQRVESLLDSRAPELTAEVKSEWAQRAAWDAYLQLDDRLARRLGARAADGRGEWAAMGHWVAGLAAFRTGDWDGAARHFDAIAQVYVAANDLRAAAAYWAARAHVRAAQ
jgi:hypothetical protein